MAHRDVIAIGGSMGAIGALKHLLRELPSDFAATVFVVIHVGARGKDLLADIFNQHAEIAVKTAVDGEHVERGCVYVAPADHHLLVLDDRIRLGRGPRENLSRPAVDPLFRSVGLSYGPRAVGVVLTGMLNDGAAGLADLKRCGGVTVVQNPSDAVEPGMPMGALQTSDVDYRAPLADLPSLLLKLTDEEPGPAVSIPPDIRLEVDIALGRPVTPAAIDTIADAVPLSCPACGGVLSEIRSWPPLRFRCQVGHAYTSETLATEKEGAVDEAMRVALRIVEERVTLCEKMADDAWRSGLDAAARANERRAEEIRAHAETLRGAILAKADMPTDKVDDAE
ncbi:chemotaxis protein CheB [Sinorhizobium mexicanum]|uniref:protein-glutamate methylesterase n=1 Tax=Sinorhizobium mexicanum TaxID=375549 RepID=A0A859QSB1_9HYPH|nr:chemotaxis protein CheB [Sinorhizobium mexicanum]MBP1887262.1 two-component system chemotaxis response regulator CheB [Sinorhizobium mexicanum]QLL60148.1 chemotaxis protein CheB [Sinorhizobium mexicanum]